MKTAIHEQIQHINPDELVKNPAFTNVITVTGPAKTIYIGGQDSINAAGEIVAKGDIKGQTEQVLKNLQTALDAAGAGLEHIVKWNILVVEGQPIQPGLEAFQKVWENRPNPPTITVAFVTGLANPDFLVEMDAIAVVPET